MTKPSGLKALLDLAGWRARPDGYMLRYIKPVLNAICTVNQVYLEHNPRTPDLYQSGVRWRREKGAIIYFPERNPHVAWKEATVPELFKDIPAMLRDGIDDCEGMACWRVAELRYRYHQPARIVIRVRDLTDPAGRPIINPDGKQRRLFHVIVGIGDKREDPSRALGMGSAEAENG
jgi:hypothetical protein